MTPEQRRLIELLARLHARRLWREAQQQQAAAA